MSANTPQLEMVIAQAITLSPLEKVRLVEEVMATLEHDLKGSDQQPRRSLLGVLAHLGPAPSAEDIDEARREMWGN